MDQNSGIINDFESLLMTRSAKKPLALYTNSEHQNKTLNTSKTGRKYSAKEVLINVSKQLKAIQNADTASYKRVGNKLDKYKKREILPIEMIPLCKEVPNNLPTKFETQCVTDTQLINVIDNAEIVDIHRGVTQEFDETFCHKSNDNDCDNKLKDGSRKPDTMTDRIIDTRENVIHIVRSEYLNKCNDSSNQESKLFENTDPITCEMDTVTCCENDVITDFNDEAKVNTSLETQGFNKCVVILDDSEVDAERSISPVLNTNKRNSTPPLVVSLYSFEEFENLAHPIIEEQEDLETAKNLINSQIIGREISIPDHIYESLHRESPILNKIECVTTSISKNDFENINTFDNDKCICIDKDLSCSESDNLSNKNRKMESKIIKSEIKDEILFSSDEEYEYLHKDVQELPLTCALETSFYDRSDVLDKTMYVGFQTASNKSIQINTDSFVKAKSILTGIDNEETVTTLKELVEIFDTGKAVNEIVQSIEFASCKQEYDSENKSLSKVELVNKEDVAASLPERCIKFEDKIGDTFKDIGLTAAEQEENVSEDIIKFKSTPRAAKVNNSIIFIDKTDETPKTPLIEDKQADGDIVMSQVIEFKSISRTPKLCDNICNTSVIGVFKNPNELISKRKLEGFKTASNKKIKLSDKALARCKKVFHEIDLSETDDLNLETVSKIDPKQTKKDNLTILPLLDSAKTVAEMNDTQSKTDFNVKINQPNIEDVDFQINDKILLQEFEDNEMSFEKTNNNVYVGFKTASDKNIIISDVAIAKSKNLIKKIINIDAEKDDNIDQCKNDFKKPAIDLNEVRDKQTRTTKEAFAKIKRSHYDIPLKESKSNLQIYESFKRPTNDFVGFKTTANNEIQISEQAREKTKDFFEDLDKNSKGHTINICNEEEIYSKTEKNYVSHVEDELNCGIDTQDFLAEELTHIENLFKDNVVEDKKPVIPAFQGFQTASRKPVVISKKALEKGKKLFEDITNKDGNLADVTNVEKDYNNAKIERQEVKGVLVNTRKKIRDKKNNDSPSFNAFQIASNEEFHVSNIALETSNKLFQDILLSHPKQYNIQTEKCSDFYDSEVACSKAEIIENILRQDKKNVLVFQNDLMNDGYFSKEQKTVVGVNATVVCKTAQMSDLSLKQNELLFSTSCLKNISKDYPVITGYKMTNAEPILMSAGAIEKTKRIRNESELKDDENMVDSNCGQTIDPKAPTNIFVGFQTASNKQIKISANALAKSKQILNDFEFKDDFSENGNNISTKNRTNQTYNIGIKALQDVYVSEKENDMLDEDIFEPKEKASPVFKSFQTASNSNNKVSISKKALKNSKELFQDIDTDDCLKNENGEGSPVFRGFQTASNKKVKISEKALSKSKELFKDINMSQLDKDLKSNKIEGTPAFIGFQTASNKKVDISEEALTKSQELLEDINISQLNKVPKRDNLEDASVSRGFQSASNKKVQISNKALAKSKELFEDIYKSHRDKDLKTNKIEDTPAFIGFQTASNKKVEISNEALAKSKELFEDLNISQLDKVHKIDNLEKALVLRGFQTASNKKVHISEKALANSKHLFKDINISQFDKDVKPEKTEGTPAFRGFQTASNKKVEISEKALAKSKQLFEDINISQLDKDPKSNNLEDTSVFRGFQTASNKKVEISEKALAKSKQLFEDINISQLDKDPKSNNLEDTSVFRGFQTASNKKVQISENALAKSRQLFEDILLSQLEKDQKTTTGLNDAVKVNNDAVHKMSEPINENTFKGFHTGSNKTVNVTEDELSKTKNVLKDRHVKEDNGNKKSENKVKNHSKVTPAEFKTEIGNALVKDVIDTQVLNDFQDTLNTEDFCKSTPKSKRSGSPILSCPRAKKRKFETPYRSKKKIEQKNTFVPPKVSKTFKFNGDYKKHKKYNLKDLDKLERGHTKTEIDPYISGFRFDNLLHFEFSESRNDYTDAKITIEDLKKIFLDSVNKKIVPDGWLDNHIKLILWKLLSYEVKYPNVMKNSCTVRNVLEQLKYRYDRELYNVQRPILRKVLEKDEVASKTMLLCVAGIYVDNISVTSVSPTSQNMELLLTDGWYCVKASTDRMLVRLAANGSIVVGTKIAVCGAELINCDQGVAPWEDTSSVRLKLSGNSVARARWPAQLGARTDVIRRPLRAVRADGGKVAAVRVLVTRVYPPLYIEKMDDGSTVTLSERLENIREAKYELERQALMEKLYEEVEKEMSDQDSQDSEGCSNERNCLESGSQISKYMKKSKDPDEYRSHLTKSQNRMLEEHNSKQRERLIERVRTKFQQKLEKSGMKTDRNVVPLLKVRVAGVVEKNGEVTKGYLSIWRPSDAVLELVTEGAWIEILNVIPTGNRNSEIQLSAGRQTVFNPYKQTNEKFKLYANTLKRKCYEIREITQNPAIATDYNEIDTVGMIFCIEPSTKEFNDKQYFQNVYIADAHKNIICVNFWGGLKKFGFENVLDTGQIVTCVNLQKRIGNTRKSIPEYRVTEFSYFTKTPKDKKALEITNELSNTLSKVKDRFCEDCAVLKSNYSLFKTRNNENVSPHNNNVSKMVSPLRKDANLNLTGLDFDSSFDTQDITPQALLRKKKVNERIEKIRFSYGEPPPLSSIHIINKSKNASATYKSPLILNSEHSKIASVQNPVLGDSPVTMNRTYVRNINPVKLNFSDASLNDNVDHFAEDFDASPPLSLDSDTLN